MIDVVKMFYVYEIIVDGLRRYVGKGRKRRAIFHLWMMRNIAARRAAGEIVRTTYFYNKLTKAWLAGAEVSVSILTKGLSEEEAYALEIELIATTPAGQLWNTNRGGDGADPEVVKKQWADQNFRNKMSATAFATITTLWADPKFSLKMKAAGKARMKDPDFRAKVKKGMEIFWADKEKKAKLIEARIKTRASPEFLAKDHAWNDLTYKAKKKAAQDARWADKEMRDKIITGQLAKLNDQEYRAQIVVARKAKWTDAKYRTKQLAAIKAVKDNPNYRAKIAAIGKAKWADPEYRAKQIAAMKAAIERKIKEQKINHG